MDFGALLPWQVFAKAEPQTGDIWSSCSSSQDLVCNSLSQFAAVEALLRMELFLESRPKHLAGRVCFKAPADIFQASTRSLLLTTTIIMAFQHQERVKSLHDRGEMPAHILYGSPNRGCGDRGILRGAAESRGLTSHRVQPALRTL